MKTAKEKDSKYVQTDVSPLQQDNFYRIKAISQDGQVQYSAVVKVGGQKSSPVISVYPNPVKDKRMQIQFTGMAAGEYQVQLISSSGQAVYNARVMVNGNHMVQSVLLNSVAGGEYLLSISGYRDKKVVKVIVE